MREKKTKDSIEEKNKMPSFDVKNILKKGTSTASVGISVAKNSVATVKKGVTTATEVVRDKSKSAQMKVLTYVSKKKNARFLEAKLSSFEDGIKEGKILAVDYVKKYVNFCLASTAISFYFARCDGAIDEAEMLEIEHDLDSIIKNKDLPDALRNSLAEISEKEDISFEDVRIYLDGVGVDTIKEFSNDIEEIIMADGIVTEDELKAKKKFDDYLIKRLETEKNE